MKRIPAIAIAVSILVGSAVGQTTQSAAFLPAPGTINWDGITFSGSLRARVEGWDWFTPTSAAYSNSYAYSGNILRFAASKKYESWDWNAEFAVPFLLGLPSTATATAPQGALGLGSNYFVSNNKTSNSAMLFPKQVYVRITHFGNSKASTLKVGRFEFLDGSETSVKNATLASLKANRVNQRLIGNFGWSDVGRSFDGMTYSYAPTKATVTFMGGVPTRGVFQTDGWGWNKVAVGYSSVNIPWGKGRHTAETRAFLIYYDDWRFGVVKTDNRPAAAKAKDFANIKIWSAGGNSVHAMETKAGTFDALVWGVMQGGKWGVQDHSAFAFAAEGGFQPRIAQALKPWIRGGYSITSGDGNASDNQHNTFFQLLPTPRPYAKFPFFNMMNNIDRFGSLTLRPHAKVTIATEFHSLSLENANDLWYAGGGVYQPWTFGYTGRSTAGKKSLANLYDVNLEYRYSARVTLTAYLGHAQGLAAMKQIYPSGPNSNFGYGEAMFRF